MYHMEKERKEFLKIDLYEILFDVMGHRDEYGIFILIELIGDVLFQMIMTIGVVTCLIDSRLVGTYSKFEWNIHRIGENQFDHSERLTARCN